MKMTDFAGMAVLSAVTGFWLRPTPARLVKIIGGVN
jgi:hypothetical protein